MVNGKLSSWTDILSRIPQEADDRKLDLDNLVEWSNKWQLEFNETKCKSLHLVSSNQRLNYHMNSQILEDTRNERDLGGGIY